MARLIVRGPDGRTAQSVDLGTHGSVLVGRAPSADAAAKEAPGADAPTPEMVTVSTPSVSAQHLLARAEGSRILVQDLNSRNGSWLLLPRGQVVEVTTPDATVQLGQPSGAPPAGDEPPTPHWQDHTGYAPALASAIREWPQLQPFDLDICVGTKSEVAGPSSIPLATGETLEVLPRATTDASWSGIHEKLWRWVARQNASYEMEARTRDEGMILASAAIRNAHREVVQAAQTGAQTLLLRGPSGAGKEMLAEVFHRHSGRSGPFVTVNCAMFSKELLRSELFGSEVGAFTGATRRIVGAVARAEGGTLLLDEIGDMPDEVQPMLLRFLDRREFQSLGQYGRAQRADVNVVAATNKDLRDAARMGKFRVDLWFRLSVHIVDVPPLRERWEDIEAYLENTTVVAGKHSLMDALSLDARTVLKAHLWEGNFRELTNFRERLPRDAAPGSVDAATCQRALERGSLNPISSHPRALEEREKQIDWAELAALATRVFAEDHGHDPASWDEQKEWNEKYLKPLLFHRLSGAGNEATPPDEDSMSALAARAASAVRADRGTALKQLARYYERFRK